jgi:hypothetical protein
MAKRKRLTPAQPGFLGTAQKAPETKSMPVGMSAPIAQVAGEASATAALAEVSQALADARARGPREAQGAIRAMVAGAYEAREAEQLDRERDAMARAAGGAEAGEGIAAFLDKRAPRFGG